MLPETLFGLGEKFVAVESTVFFAAQFANLKNIMAEFLPEEERTLLDEYEQNVSRILRVGNGLYVIERLDPFQTLAHIPSLRRPVYMTVAQASIRPEVILQLMSKVPRHF